jgi:hypothetical protein
VRAAELVGVAQPVARCGEIGGIGRRGEIAQRRVRSPLIVVVGPDRDLRAGVFKASVELSSLSDGH